MRVENLLNAKLLSDLPLFHDCSFHREYGVIRIPIRFCLPKWLRGNGISWSLTSAGKRLTRKFAKLHAPALTIDQRHD